MNDLNEEFADILVNGIIEKAKPSPAEIAEEDHVDLPRIRLHFDRHSLGRLRLLLDRLNKSTEENNGISKI